MDPITLLIILVIIASAIILDFYKRQENRITNNLHADNLKQLLTITALDYKLGQLDDNDISEDDRQIIAAQITQLISSYDNAEIPAETFKCQMDNLLYKLN